MSPVPNIRLNDGAQIPQLGFGMSRIDPDEAKGATLTALNAGYRHIDTAQMYGNSTPKETTHMSSGARRSGRSVLTGLRSSSRAS